MSQEEYGGRSDGQLVTAWLDGHAPALRALVDRHRAAAVGLALRLCGNRDLAEDLAQEAFLRAVNHLGRFDTALPFRPWLFRILIRLYIDHLRAGLTPQVQEVEGHGANPDSELFVQALLARLSVSHRSIIILRELVGLSYEELASYYHIPIGTVRSRLAHARMALKVAYVELGGEVRHA